MTAHKILEVAGHLLNINSLFRKGEVVQCGSVTDTENPLNQYFLKEKWLIWSPWKSRTYRAMGMCYVFKSMGRQLENIEWHSSSTYNGQKVKSEFSLNLEDFKTLSQLLMMRWRLGNLQRSFPVAGADWNKCNFLLQRQAYIFLLMKGYSMAQEGSAQDGWINGRAAALHCPIWDWGGGKWTRQNGKRGFRLHWKMGV